MIRLIYIFSCLQINSEIIFDNVQCKCPCKHMSVPVKTSNNPMLDVTILLDGSDSIKPHEWLKIKDVTVNWVRELSMAQVTILQFSNRARIEYGPSISSNQISKIRHMKQMASATRLTNALDFIISRQFTSIREETNHIDLENRISVLFILTDEWVLRTTKQSPDLRIFDVVIIVGVGNQVDWQFFHTVFNTKTNSAMFDIHQIHNYRQLGVEVPSLRDTILSQAEKIRVLRRNSFDRCECYILIYSFQQKELRGITGIKGETGERGMKGRSGLTGLHGETGPKGINGPNGKQGKLGLSKIGIPGSDGLQGERGQTGLFGKRGKPGPIGNSGPIGDKGDKGMKGMRGLNGLTGKTGQSGTLGKAKHGLRGPCGNAGKPGTTGLIGNYGMAGYDGNNGTPGIPGTIGIIGSKGTSGYKGIKGVRGITGENGNPGLVGNKGLLGTDGNKGMDGLEGLVGNKGVKGIKGITGIHGIKGTKGIRGQSGTLGYSGKPGIPGNNGKIGLPGHPGYKGNDGSNGVPGRPGNVGNPGNNGPKGILGIRGHVRLESYYIFIKDIIRKMMPPCACSKTTFPKNTTSPTSSSINFTATAPSTTSSFEVTTPSKQNKHPINMVILLDGSIPVGSEKKIINNNWIKGMGL